MKIGQVDALTLASAPWALELLEAGDDYLRRSGEEITADEQEALFYAAVTRDDMALFVALNDRDEFAAFAVLRVVAGGVITGDICHIWQVYVKPGRARLRDVFTRGMALFTVWAKEHGCRRFSLLTSRQRPAYRTILEGMGFLQTAWEFERGV